MTMNNTSTIGPFKDINMDIFRRLGQIAKTNLFTQTIIETNYERMSRNQAKLHLVGKL